MLDVEKPVNRQTNGWGIDLTYKDALGKWHETPSETVQAILRVMGAEATMLGAPSENSVIVTRVGDQRDLSARGTVLLETGETLPVELRLPARFTSRISSLATGRSETSPFG